MLTTRRTKSSDHKKGFKELACACGKIVRVDSNVGGVICGDCVQSSVAPPDCYAPPKEKKEKEPKEIKESEIITTGKFTGFPRCWHLKKEFIGPDGITYHKGKPVDNNLPTPELNNNLPTPELNNNLPDNNGTM